MGKLARSPLPLVVTVWLVFGFSTPVTAAPVVGIGPLVNGGFSVPGSPPEPFAAWTTNLIFGNRPTDGGGFARFHVAESGDAQQLEQMFALPDSPSLLSFEFQLETSAAPPSGTFPDSFQAVLYDKDLNSLLPKDVFFPAFFSVDNSGAQFFDPALVTVVDLGDGRKRVELDISTLLPQEALLEFVLLDGNGQTATSVSLDNVTVVPEPATIALCLVGVAILLGRRLLGR